MKKYLTVDQIKKLLPENIAKKKLEDLYKSKIDLTSYDLLIEKIMARTGFSKEKTITLVETIFKELRGHLIDGRTITLSKFGTFRRNRDNIIVTPSGNLVKKLKTSLKFFNFKFEYEEE